ncbi:MAG: serine hydrolase [Saprospiraceae bacterium]|nr:serine hydrolase [Saprospiraceae bacterium]
MKFYVVLLCLFIDQNLISQSSYFPPLTGDQWETISPSDLGWCQQEINNLDSFLIEKGTKAIIILKKGKIVKETYYGTFTRDSSWYWASAGKSLTSFLVGMAQEKGLLNIQDKTSEYLGKAWTSLTSDQEDKITLWHQMTMTTGLNDNVPDDNCMTPLCLQYKADAGTRWAYHNAPYRLIQDVVAKAWGKSYQNFMTTQLSPKTGINGFWYDYIMYSKPRSMARFGLLVLNKGIWNGQKILSDEAFLNASVSPSQNINKSYGLLWWLNGQTSFMIPDLQTVFSGSLIPNAPNDMYCALGKNDQKIYIIPSQDMVIIRMGNDGGQITGAVSSFDNLLWAKINALSCVSSVSGYFHNREFIISPNPFSQNVSITYPTSDDLIYDIKNIYGKVHASGVLNMAQKVDLDLNIPSGIYFFCVKNSFGKQIFVKKMIKI